MKERDSGESGLSDGWLTEQLITRRHLLKTAGMGAASLAAGAILHHPATEEYEHGGIIEGARTTAAMAASRFGPVLKVSEDGVITFFDGAKVWDI